MQGFTVDIQQKSFAPMQLPPDLVLTYRHGSANVRGGPVDAQILATGPRQTLFETLDYLRNPVIVYNYMGTEVWWGYIAAITGTIGSLQIGLSIDQVSNRIKVIYTYNDQFGKAVKGETAWSTNQDSVDTYGAWEMLKSIGDASTEQANQDLIASLNVLAWPMGTPIFGSASRDQDSVNLLCRGWFSSLSSTYYTRADGKVAYPENGGTAISMGQAYTATTIAFQPHQNAIHDLNGLMKSFKSGQRIRVTGSASNNASYRVTNDTDEDGVTIVSTAIYFAPQNDVIGPADQFKDVSSGDLIRISGASASGNNGDFWVNSSEQDGTHITISSSTIVAGPSGPSITVKRSTSIGVDTDLQRELPGANTTITTIGNRVAQSFLAGGTDPWKVYEAWVRLMKVGSPTDNVVVELWSTSGTNLPTTLLDSASIAGATLSENTMFWFKFTFGGTVSLTPGTTYWLVVRRSGGSERVNYYMVDVDEAAGYADGVAKYWDGTAWQFPVTVLENNAASMPFTIYGKETTTVQIQKIISGAGQFLTGVQVFDPSHILSYQFREGRLRALDEINTLLDGDADVWGRLFAMVSPQRMLQIFNEPAVNTYDMVRVDLENNWHDYLNSPLEPGVLPIGKWAEVIDLPPGVTAYTRITPFFVEAAEYFADRNELQVTPRGAWNSHAGLGVRQG